MGLADRLEGASGSVGPFWTYIVLLPGGHYRNSQIIHRLGQ